MTHWSRVTHQKAPSAGIWLPGWGLGRNRVSIPIGSLMGQAGDGISRDARNRGSRKLTNNAANVSSTP